MKRVKPLHQLALLTNKLPKVIMMRKVSNHPMRKSNSMPLRSSKSPPKLRTRQMSRKTSNPLMPRLKTRKPKFLKATDLRKSRKTGSTLQNKILNSSQLNCQPKLIRIVEVVLQGPKVMKKIRILSNVRLN
jgi:hypothetical protein